MSISFHNPEKEIRSDSFIIELSADPDNLYVVITDTNPDMRNLKAVAQNQQVASHQQKKVCWVPRTFMAISDNGSLLRNQDICRDIIDHCGPDETIIDQVELQGQDERYTGEDEAKQEDDTTKSTGLPAGNYARGVFKKQWKIYGFRNFFGVDRSRFRTLIYHLTIPQTAFDVGYNSLQIFLFHENKEVTPLLTEGIIKSGISEGQTLKVKDEQDRLQKQILKSKAH